MGLFTGIVFNRPLDEVYIPVPQEVAGGDGTGRRVRVPLGKGDKPAVGYCVPLEHEAPADIEPKRLKTILEVLDDPPLIDTTMLELTWMASYYACWSTGIDAVVPAGVKKQAGTRIGTYLMVPEAARASPTGR